MDPLREARPFAADAPILLGGPPGSGKTTVGRALAQRLQLPFDDLDDLIAARAGRSVGDVFAVEGEEGFRSRERASLAEVLAAPRRRVVALGGGALVDPSSRAAALARGVVVGLVAPTPVLFRRLELEPGRRPLLDAGDADQRAARLQALLVARREVYTEAHVHLDGARGASLVAGDVARAVADRFAWVPSGAGGYPVRSGSDAGLAASDAAFALGARSLVVISDDQVAPLWGDAVTGSLAFFGRPLGGRLTFASGESSKRLATLERLAGELLATGADRGSALVAVGGGVTSDLAGLLAALYFRGIQWICVPTSLLSMVDAAVGGKTAADLPAAKNAIGAFHPPRAVVVDATHARTEPERARRSGLAEVVKTALLGDPALLDLLEAHADAARAGDPGVLRELVERSLAVKIGVVGRDELERGERVHLNLGHTFGHALEAASGFSGLTHGEAISVGLVAALRVGEDRGVTELGLAARCEGLLRRLGLPTGAPRTLCDAACRLVGADKKRAGSGHIRFVVVRRPGEPGVLDEALDPLARALAAAVSS